MRGGYYCSKCGTTTATLPAGQVNCTRCGNLGLRGYSNDRPVRTACPVDGCDEQVWDDGDVNPGDLQHRWARHEPPAVPTSEGDTRGRSDDYSHG